MLVYNIGFINSTLGRPLVEYPIYPAPCHLNLRFLQNIMLCLPVLLSELSTCHTGYRTMCQFASRMLPKAPSRPSYWQGRALALLLQACEFVLSTSRWCHIETNLHMLDYTLQSSKNFLFNNMENLVNILGK